MNEMPLSPEPEQPRKSNTGMIIAVVAVVVLCCCCVAGFGGWWLWNNGDQFIQGVNTLLYSFA